MGADLPELSGHGTAGSSLPDCISTCDSDASCEGFSYFTGNVGDTTTIAGSASGSLFMSPICAAVSPDSSFALVAGTIYKNMKRIDLATNEVTILEADPEYIGIGGVSISYDGSFALLAENQNRIIRKPQGDRAGRGGHERQPL